MAGPKVSTATVDVTTFTPPSGWKHADQKISVEYSAANTQGGAAASIMIMRSFPGTTDARANFDKAWANFITATLPDAPRRRSRRPLVSMAGSSCAVPHVHVQGRAAKTTVLAATRDASCVIVLATTIGTTYQKDVDKFFTTLRFAAPAVRHRRRHGDTRTRDSGPIRIRDAADSQPRALGRMGLQHGRRDGRGPVRAVAQ